MNDEFPKAWKHLKFFEEILRNRENNRFDDAEWYRFGRNQNIDKQHLPKILVPRLAVNLHCVSDDTGEMCLDNVDCGGVRLAEDRHLGYVTAVLNGPVANYVWRRISKPFLSDYRSANKQFIAPLPVPAALRVDEQRVENLSQTLTTLHSDRRSASDALDRRLDGMPENEQTIVWLFPDIETVEILLRRAPVYMDRQEAKAWAKERLERAITDRLGTLDGALAGGGQLRPDLTDGELCLSLNGRRILDRVFVAPAEGEIVLAQWRRTCQSIGSASRTNAKALVRELCRTRSFGSKEHRRQVIDLAEKIMALEDQILKVEAELNDILYGLYGLSDEERRMIEKDGWTPFG
jgi:hypothetical protein